MKPLYELSSHWFDNTFPYCLRIDKLQSKIFPRGHDFIEFNLTIKGECTEIVNGMEHKLRPGTFTIFFPHQIHSINCSQDNVVNMYVGGFGLDILFDTSEANYTLSQLLLSIQRANVSHFYLDEATAYKMSALMDEMISELKDARPWCKAMFKAKLIELFIIFDRNRMVDLYTENEVLQRTRNNNIWGIVQYVYQNSAEDITLESLSERFYLSVPHISSSFKAFIGENFHSFLERIRIAKACSLLNTTSYSITEIALEVGFRSYTTFSRVFLKHIKMSPTQYKQMRDS